MPPEFPKENSSPTTPRTASELAKSVADSGGSLPEKTPPTRRVARLSIGSSSVLLMLPAGCTWLDFRLTKSGDGNLVEVSFTLASGGGANFSRVFGSLKCQSGPRAMTLGSPLISVGLLLTTGVMH